MMNSYAASLSSAIAAGLLAIASAFDAVTVLTSPAPIEGVGYYTAPVSAGETVIVDWQITKRVDCPGFTGRVWEGENGFFLAEPLQPTALPMGTITPKIPTAIPPQAPIGDLRLTIKGAFDCEGREEIHFSLTPVKFKVMG